MISRQTILSIAAVAACFGPCLNAAPANAQQKITYMVVNNLFSTPAYVAAENGYWAKQGLDVAVKLTSSGRAVVQAVQAGDAQFGHAALSTTIASARASGNLLKGVRFFGSGKRTHSLVMTTESRHIRFVDTLHIEGGPDTVIRF
jgi:ABC-type nitrate/sulfonate/bicarbonate transport system substrate-binding protein